MFTALEALRVWSEGIQRMTTFINICAMPLRSFHVSFTEHPTAADLHRFHTALVSHCSHASLQSLSIQLPPFAVPASAQLHSLAPLLCFVNLAHVDIVSPVGFDLNDDIVSDMARAWPHLEELELSSLEPPSAPRVTLAGLCAIAQRCPQLELLHMAFDATIIPPPAHPIYQDNLYRLSVDNSPVGTPMSVATFLAGIFTCLTAIPTNLEHRSEPEEGFLPSDFAMHRRWKEVEALLPGLLETRQEED